MTGETLINRLPAGGFLRLAHGKGKVHRAYIDPRTGDRRICRPSILGKVRNGVAREWVQVSEREYLEAPCGECK